MTPETEAQIRNVRKFGRYASWFCGLVAAMAAILFVFSVWNIVSGPTSEGFKVKLGAYAVTGDHMSTMGLKTWSLIVVIVVFAILGAVVFHLWRLFSHLSAGRIYTRENVRHIRRIGLLALGIAVVQLVVPMLSFALIEVGFVDRVTMSGDGGSGVLLLGSGSLSGFITAALVLLASWIMDVGRQTTDDAAQMRHEADLVI